MSEGARLPRRAIQPAAEWLVEHLAPACRRPPLIVGSYRRMRSPVALIGDLEIVCLPREVAGERKGQGSLFATSGEPTPELGTQAVSAVWEVVNGLADPANQRLEIRHRPGKWAEKRAARVARQMRLAVPWVARPDGSSLPVELYLPECSGAWGLTVAIRTGPQGFSRALATYARSLKMPSSGGRLRRWRGTREALAKLSRDEIAKLPPIDCETEEAVFERLGLEWVEPWDRRGAEDGRPVAPRGAR